MPAADFLLTYCTNVHPGESLGEVLKTLRGSVSEVKTRVSADWPFQPQGFNTGLRLAARAADELLNPGALDAFSSELSRLGLCVTTLNGFPYGAFHQTRVKETVYRPDWQEPARVEYTLALAKVLSRLLPQGATGSISSVPGCMKPRITAGAADQMTRHLLQGVRGLLELERITGKTIVLALEPEPACFLETTAEALAFFRDFIWQRDNLARFAAECGTNLSTAEADVRRFLGVCLDACHAAVEFETPSKAFQALRGAGIAIPKVQISAGLKLAAPSPEELAALSAFDEPVYLHQTVVRSGGTLQRFDDLPEALARQAAFARDARSNDDTEWRVHFHVPVSHARLGLFESTQPELAELLDHLSRVEDVPLLEVETYTWDVLPPEHRAPALPDAIARELRWTAEQLVHKNPSTNQPSAEKTS